MVYNSNSQKSRARKCEADNSADAHICGKGGGGAASGARAEISLQPVKTMVMHVIPLQHMEVHGAAGINPVACGGPHTGAGRWSPKEAVTLQWSRLLAGLKTLWRRAHTGAGFLEDL